MRHFSSGRLLPRLAGCSKPTPQRPILVLFWMAILCVRLFAAAPADKGIVVENARLRAVLGANGSWQSLVDRASGRELIPPGAPVPFAIARFEASPTTQTSEFSVYTNSQRPLAAADTASPARSANRIRKEGDRLVVGFAGSPASEISYRLAVEPDAIIFSIASVKGPRPRELDLVRLGVAPRAHVGSRLAATWDDTLAVGLATANLQTIASARRTGGQVLVAASTQDSPGPRLEGAGVALVAAPPAQYRAILARLAARCPDLPRNEERGVASRDLPVARGSYWFLSFGEADVDRVIDACRQSGLSQVMLSSNAWCASPGHYLFNTKLYPEGQASLRRTVTRLHEAGILVGMHCFASKVAKIDPYVSPVPDSRFLVDRSAVLAGAVGVGDTVIRTASDLREWPGSPVASQRVWEGGVAKHQEVVLDGEIVQYAAIGPEGRWDSFLGCTRGAWKTTAVPHPAGTAARHFGVDGCINGYIIDQETSLLGEVADRLAAIFNDCGFDMVYFDGGEDVDRRRFTYYVSNFQAGVMRRFTKRPLVHMGTIMTHPLWHSFTRSGTVDTYLNTIHDWQVSGKGIDSLPTVRAHIDKSVDYLLSVREDMTPGELGWFGIWPKGTNTAGLQLDEAEYLMARSLAYDAPISLQTSFRQMDSHPLTPGVLEIVRAYEKLRLSGALDEATRAPLRQKGAEFALIRQGEAWRMVGLGPVEKTAGGQRFSVGKLDGGAVAILWGAEREKRLKFPAQAAFRVETLEGKPVALDQEDSGVIFRVGPRRLTVIAPRLSSGALRQALLHAEQPY